MTEQDKEIVWDALHMGKMAAYGLYLQTMESKSAWDTYKSVEERMIHAMDLLQED